MDLRLISLHSDIPEKIKELYEEAFPIKERRLWNQQLELFEKEQLLLSEINMENIFVGFVFYWNLNHAVFIEHFAIDESVRGNGIGSRVMALFEKNFRSIVLESEAEKAGQDAVRRIRFYEKLGYQKFPFSYEQPPYISGTEFLSMHLLFKHVDPDIHSFEKIKKEIYSKVYQINI